MGDTAARNVSGFRELGLAFVIAMIERRFEAFSFPSHSLRSLRLRGSFVLGLPLHGIEPASTHPAPELQINRRDAENAEKEMHVE